MPAFKHAARLRQAARQPLSYLWWETRPLERMP
jgi:hypothetical protein